METEKAARFSGLRQIGKAIRFLELAGALLLLSYSSSLAKNSGDFLRRAAAFLLSPAFVFLLGNAIVAVLFAKSGEIVPDSGVPDRFSDPPPPPHLGGEPQEAVFEDKEVCCLEIRANPTDPVDDADQFRRTVEDFIAKHQRFQRQESLSRGFSSSEGWPEPLAV